MIHHNDIKNELYGYQKDLENIKVMMTKEEVMKLHEELNELSAFEEQNLERMVEIAKVLTAYYMKWKQKNTTSTEEKKINVDIDSI